jgi:hypothetical protein
MDCRLIFSFSHGATRALDVFDNLTRVEDVTDATGLDAGCSTLDAALVEGCLLQATPRRLLAAAAGSARAEWSAPDSLPLRNCSFAGVFAAAVTSDDAGDCVHVVELVAPGTQQGVHSGWRCTA